MTEPLNILVGLAIGLNLIALGSGRLPSLIRAAAAQGVLLGIMPLLIDGVESWHLIAVAAATIGVKGLLIPALLGRAMRAAHIERELNPTFGFMPALLLGAAGTVAAVTLSHWLPLLPAHRESLLVAGSASCILTGLLLLVGRTKAISQVCGYLILENGIYLFGLLLLHSTPMLVEGGILLDLTVTIFIIGIVVDRIQRAFDSLDTRKLTALQE